MRNLIRDPRHQEVVTRMNAALFETLAVTEGLSIRSRRIAASVNRSGADRVRAWLIFRIRPSRRRNDRYGGGSYDGTVHVFGYALERR